MIFCIKVENEKDYNSILLKLNSNYDFCFSGKNFYINYNGEKPLRLNKVQITEIKDINDLSECSDFVKNWCKNILINQQLKDFENSKDGQERIKQIIEMLEVYDKQINKKGVTSGNAETNSKEKC